MNEAREFHWWRKWKEEYPERFTWYSEAYPDVDREFVCYYPIDFHTLDPDDIWAQEVKPEPKRIVCYVHIPFCKFICRFCCYSKFPFDSSKVKAYLRALEKEIEMYSGLEYLGDASIMALYLGGGTPSVLDTAQTRDLMDCLRSRLNLEPDAEITIEAHPLVFDETKAKLYLDLGINRISFGVQTFEDSLLKPPLFFHKRRDSMMAIETARSAGFPRIGIDLLYRQPGQTLEHFRRDLAQAVELGVSSVSCYSLLWPPNTAPPPQPEQAADIEMDRLASEFLTKHGYLQFATAEFAKPGEECIYERNYWHAPTPEMLALGAGAVSFLRGYIYVNIHSLEGYGRYLREGRFPVLMGKRLTREEEMSRFMALGLKCISVSKTKFRELYGVSIEDIYGDILNELVSIGLLAVDNECVRLTDKGKVYVDNVSKAFYTENNIGKPQTVGMLLQDAMPDDAP